MDGRTTGLALGWMLAVDALSAVACVVIAFFILRKISGRSARLFSLD
jgi:hypothetical protein